MIVLTAISAAMRLDAWLLLPVVIAAHIWFVGNLGLFLSVISKSSNRAFSALLLTLLAIIAGSWIVGYFAEQHRTSYRLQDYYILQGGYRHAPPGVESLLEPEILPDLLNPIRIWWMLTEYQRESVNRWVVIEVSVVTPIASAIFYCFAGCCLYSLAWFRFRRESQRL